MPTQKQTTKIDSIAYWPLAEQVMRNIRRLIQIDEKYRTVLLATCLDSTNIRCEDVDEFINLINRLHKKGKRFNTWIDEVTGAHVVVQESSQLDERIP